MRLKFIATALMALLCTGAWAQQQPSRPGMGQRNPLLQKQELRQQAMPRAGEEETLEVYFDVKLADFMSPEYINIQVVNCWEPIEYDEASGLFKANVSLYDYQTGELSYWVRYDDYEKNIDIFPKKGTFTPDKPQTISVDMTGYRQVAFKTSDPDNWKFQSVEMKKAGDEYFDSTLSAWDLEESNYCMEAGEYVVQATICPQGGNTEYIGGLPQAVTLGAADTDIVYEVHPENYHQVTITLTDRDGLAMSGSDLHIRLYSTDGCSPYYNTSLDDEGKAVYMLHDGQYSCVIEKDASTYYQGEFTVSGKDMTVNATLSPDLAKLTVKLTGGLLANFIRDDGSWLDGSLTIVPPHGGSEVDIRLVKQEDNTFASAEPAYIRSGQYEYELDFDGSLDGSTGQLHTGGSLSLTGDYELVLDFPAEEYGEVSVSIVDVEGAPATDEGYYEFDLYDSYSQRLYYRYNYAGENIFYLPPGDYNISYQTADFDYEQGITKNAEQYIEPFTVVAGESSQVTIRLEEREKAKVDVQVKLPLELVETIYRFQLSFLKDNIYYQAYSSGVVPIEPQTGIGTANLEIPKGMYTYELWPEGLNRTATIDIQGDTTLSFDFTNEPYLHVTLTDEAGNPLTEDNGEAILHVYQGGQNPLRGDYGFTGFLEPGTYQVWGYATFYSFYGRISQIQQTVTMGTTTQHINITVPTPDPAGLYVEFYILDEERGATIHMPGTVTLNGVTAPLDDDGWVVLGNLPAGSYPYTVQAEGYEPCTGTVEVYASTEVIVYLTRQSGTTGIDTPAATDDGMFCLFPTIATDALHILPVAAANGEWTVRITSPHGMTMYNDRHVLNAETVLPVANLVPGLYLLTLDNGTETVTYKFVKR